MNLIAKLAPNVLVSTFLMAATIAGSCAENSGPKDCLELGRQYVYRTSMAEVGSERYWKLVQLLKEEIGRCSSLNEGLEMPGGETVSAAELYMIARMDVELTKELQTVDSLPRSEVSSLVHQAAYHREVAILRGVTKAVMNSPIDDLVTSDLVFSVVGSRIDPAEKLCYLRSIGLELITTADNGMSTLDKAILDDDLESLKVLIGESNPDQSPLQESIDRAMETADRTGSELSRHLVDWRELAGSYPCGDID